MNRRHFFAALAAVPLAAIIPFRSAFMIPFRPVFTEAELQFMKHREWAIGEMDRLARIPPINCRCVLLRPEDIDHMGDLVTPEAIEKAMIHLSRESDRRLDKWLFRS